MKPKHTPGPWVAVTWDDSSCARPEVSICANHTESSRLKIAYIADIEQEAQEANARLIAAAPDLLELARYIRGCLTETGECIIKLGQPMDEMVTSLLSKATGGEG